MAVSKELLKTLNKKHGEKVFRILSDRSRAKVDVIPTGSLSLDYKTGVGGIPRGRITELFGPESTGKSTVCQYSIAHAQKLGLNAAFIDTEQSFDEEYAALCGVVFDDSFVFSQPDSMEKALDLTEDLIKSKEIGLIVFDSVVGISPQKELDDHLGDPNVSLISRLMTQFGRRNIYPIRENNVAVVFTNQVRDKIGSYISMLDTTGGHALKHYAALRIQLTKSTDIKEGKEVIGVEYRAQIKKNKVANPLGTAKFSIYFGKGIWVAEDVLTNALEYGIMSMRGSYVTYKGDSLAQGKAAAIEILENDEKLRGQVRDELMETLGGVDDASDSS